jgi:hypothetical protein
MTEQTTGCLEYWIRQITDRAIMRRGSMTRFQ